MFASLTSRSATRTRVRPSSPPSERDLLHADPAHRQREQDALAARVGGNLERRRRIALRGNAERRAVRKQAARFPERELAELQRVGVEHELRRSPTHGWRADRFARSRRTRDSAPAAENAGGAGTCLRSIPPAAARSRFPLSRRYAVARPRKAAATRVPSADADRIVGAHTAQPIRVAGSATVTWPHSIGAAKAATVRPADIPGPLYVESIGCQPFGSK